MGHIAHTGKLGSIALPLEVFRDPRLSPSTKMVLVTLLDYRDGKTGKCNPGAKAIAKIAGVSESSVPGHIKKLVAAGWLKYTRGNSETSNDYTVIVPLETGFKYTQKPGQMTKEAWAATADTRKTKIAEYKVKKIIERKEFSALSQYELIAEIAKEEKAGKTWIPNEYLENFEIVRGGDNSDDARADRHDERKAAEKAKKTAEKPKAQSKEYAQYLQDMREMPAAQSDEYAQYLRDIQEM